MTSQLKTFAVAICNDDQDQKIEVIEAEDWKKAILAHEFNPFVTDPEGEEGEEGEEGGSEPVPDPDMIPESYEDAVTEAFNMDCDIAVQELRTRIEDDSIHIYAVDVE